MRKDLDLLLFFLLLGNLLIANVIEIPSIIDSMQTLRLKDPQRAIRYGRNYLNNGDDKLQEKIKNKLGEIYLDLGMPTLALTNFIDASEKSKVKTNPWNKINIGNVYFQQEKWAEAKELYLQSLDIFRRRDINIGNNISGVTVALSNIGMIEQNLYNYDDALVYFKEAINVRRGTAQYKTFQKSLTGSRIDYPASGIGVAFVHGLLADLYNRWGLFDMAIEQLQASDSLLNFIPETTQDNQLKLRKNNYLGNNCSRRMQIFAKTNNPAGLYYESRSAIQLLKDSPDHLVLHLKERANIQHGQDSVYAALETLDKALKICELNGLIRKELEILEFKINLLKEFKLEKSALDVAKKFIAKKQSIENDRISMLFESLHYKSELIKNKKILIKNQLRQKIYFIFFGFIMVLLGLIIINYRNKKNAASKDILIHKQKKLIAENVLRNKENELVTLSANIVTKNDLLNSMVKDLEYHTSLLDSKADRKLMEPLMKKIQEKVDDSADWEQFQIQFSLAYPDFMNSLIENNEGLRSADIKLCCYLKMNMNTKDIAKVTGLSIRAIENKRYRLRKKLNLDKDVSLDNYIHSISIGKK